MSRSNYKAKTKNNLSYKDYINILEYYNKNIPKSKELVENEAEKLLSDKLCKCIKIINSPSQIKNEARAIGICTKTIFNKKGLRRGSFQCKTPRFVKFNKTNKFNKTIKMRKKI